MYGLSDEKLISSAQTDMAYKYFLDLDPEAKMIAPSLLTKCRKTRITEDILEGMLRETIRQAIEKGLIKTTAIIVDSTHTTANARPKTATQILRDMSKQLRRGIYREMVELSEKLPDKPSETVELAGEIEYTYRLLDSVGLDILQSEKSALIELYEHIKELLDTDRIREIHSKFDEDARFGHKTTKSTFFGFKSHLAMTEERLITGIEVTHGGEADCHQFPALLEQSISNGIQVKEAIGDMAYVSEDNLDTCEEKAWHFTQERTPLWRWQQLRRWMKVFVSTRTQVYFNVQRESLQCGLRKGRLKTGTPT